MKVIVLLALFSVAMAAPQIGDRSSRIVRAAERFGRSSAFSMRKPGADCQVCETTVDYLQAQIAVSVISHIDEMKLFLSSSCGQYNWMTPACEAIGNYGQTEFYQLVANTKTTPLSACTEISACLKAEDKAKQLKAEKTPKVDLDVMSKLHLEKNNGHIDECLVCKLGFSWLTSQFGSTSVEWVQELRRVLQFGFCEQDKMWGPLCDAATNWGEYRLLLWLNDNRVTPEDVCTYLDTCHYARPKPAVVAQRLVEIIKKENMTRLAHGWGNTVECGICIGTLDFLQAQSAIAGLTIGEEIRDVTKEFCNIFSFDRGTEVAKLCQSLANWGAFETVQFLSDNRLNIRQVCEDFESCPSHR